MDSNQTETKCIRNGCKRRFNPKENTETSCNYHPGKPIFHDLKKGWTCCNKIVYDWDEFQAIKTCAIGFHLTQEETNSGQSEFFQSNTVSNAQKAIDKEENKVVIKSIDDFNKEEAKKIQQIKAVNEPKEKKIFVSEKGLHKCLNKGCQKEYDPKENSENSCNYHPGEPIFHDLKKFWTCCKSDTYDWDDFMKLPKCKTGLHNPKYI